MSNALMWYQRPVALAIFSLLAASLAIYSSYDRRELVNQAEQEFVYYYQAEADSGYVAISPPVEVRVTFRGSARARERLAGNTQRTIHSRVSALGLHSVPIPLPEDIKRLKFVRMTPETAEVLVDTQVLRTVRIKGEIEGEPAPGYQVRSVTITPPEIDVLVPQSLDVPAEISTKPVSIRNIDDHGLYEGIGLSLPAFVVVKDSDHDGVSVNVEIVPVRKIRLLDPVAIQVEGVPAGFRVTAHPAFVAVQALVPEKADSSVFPVRARVRLSDIPRTEDGGLREGSYGGHEVQVDGLPRGSESIEHRPGTVTLEVERIQVP